MAKSSYFVGILALSLIFFALSAQMQMAEAKDCGWVYKSDCFDKCNWKCKNHWGAYSGSCKWYNGHKACLCYYGDCH